MDYSLISLFILEWGMAVLLLHLFIYLIFCTKSWVKDGMGMGLFIAVFGFITLLWTGGIQLDTFNNNDYNGLMVFTKTSVYNELQRTFTGGEPIPDVQIAKNTFIVFDCE